MTDIRHYFDYDTARQALTAEGLSGAPLGQRLAELFLASQRPTDAAPSAPDPIDEARGRRALDLAHCGGWPGPQPRSPATGRPIPPPPGRAGRTPTRKPHPRRTQ